MSNASLVAPLDLARFVMAYLALVLVPGYGVAALVRPRAAQVERCALAIPCAYGLVAVSGLATALLHVSYDLRAYLALAVPLAAAGAWALRQRHDRPSSGQQDSWWLAPLGVAVAQVGAIVAIYARYVVPSGSDAVTHVMWTRLIANAHVFPIALLSSHVGANDGGFYPPVFHTLTALVLDAAPMPVYHAVFFSVLATVALLPVALYCYVRAITGSARLGGLAALASLAFEPLPFFVLGQGLYTFTASLLIVPAVAIALRDGLGEGDRRAVALAGLLGIGLFYTHPTEFVTVGLLALGLVPPMLWRNRRGWVWLRAVIYGSVVAAAWLAAALPALIAVRRTMVSGAQAEISATHDFTRPATVDLGAAVSGYVQWVYGHNLGYLLLAAVVAGTVWCLVRRRRLGLVAVQAILCVLFIDSVSYNALQRFYNLSFPWALWERLAATHYWFALPLAAVGIEATAGVLWRVLYARQRVFSALAVSPLVALGLVLPYQIGAARMAAYTTARKVVAPTDLGSLAWLTTYGAPQSVVVNDGELSQVSTFDMPSDAGLWMPALGAPQPFFFRSGSGPGAMDDRLYVLRHIADNPLPSRAERFVRQYDVRYVFYGAGLRSNATRHLNLARLLADPHMRLVYSSAACHADREGNPTACPAAGSYVFALGGSA